MEEYQERDSSSDEERQTIDDDDMEDSQTDTAELWMSDRNDEDTKFVRTREMLFRPRNTRRQPRCLKSHCSGEEKSFQRYTQGVWRHRLPQSQTSTCEMQCARRFGTGIQSPCMCVCVSVCVYVCMYICTHTYMYMYIYLYIYIYHICIYMCIYLPC
jgi:hypothetical protein